MFKMVFGLGMMCVSFWQLPKMLDTIEAAKSGKPLEGLGGLGGMPGLQGLVGQQVSDDAKALIRMSAESKGIDVSEDSLQGDGAQELHVFGAGGKKLTATEERRVREEMARHKPKKSKGGT